MYGVSIEGRWLHVMTAIDSNTLIVAGGSNLSSYLDFSSLYKFHFDQRTVDYEIQTVSKTAETIENYLAK